MVCRVSFEFLQLAAKHLYRDIELCSLEQLALLLCPLVSSL